jgi:hypothetical protein
MPYAPGTTYHAGDYFAAAGPRINENIQQYLSNKRDREQMTATAEMLGRYIKDDPHAMELFGPDLAKIPGASLGAAKGIVGGLTSYLAQRHLSAVEQTAAEHNRILEDRLKQQGDIAQQELGLKQTAADAADASRQRVAAFNEAVNQAMQPGPPQVPYALGKQPNASPQLDYQTAVRYAAKAGALGDPQINAMLTAMERYGLQERDRKPGFVTSPKGQEIAYGPWSGVFQPLYGAPEDSSQGIQATPILGPDGKVIQYALPTRHGYTPLAHEKAARQITPGEQATIVKSRAKVRDSMKKLMLEFNTADEADKPELQGQLDAYQKDLDALDAALQGAKPGKAGAGAPARPAPFRQGNIQPSDIRMDGMMAPDEGEQDTGAPDESEPAPFQQGNIGPGDIRMQGLAPQEEDTAAAPEIPPAQTPTGPVARIKMIHPDGRLVGVRADQVDEALRQGFKRAR